MRFKVLLICSECLSRNYVTTIKSDSDKKVELKKFCKHCNKQTIHKISKQEVTRYGLKEICCWRY